MNEKNTNDVMKELDTKIDYYEDDIHMIEINLKTYDRKWDDLDDLIKIYSDRMQKLYKNVSLVTGEAKDLIEEKIKELQFNINSLNKEKQDIEFLIDKKNKDLIETQKELECFKNFRDNNVLGNVVVEWLKELKKYYQNNVNNRERFVKDYNKNSESINIINSFLGSDKDEPKKY